MVVLKNVTHSYDLHVTSGPDSDHGPVIITLDTDTQKHSREITTTNWSEFKNTLQLRPINIRRKEDIDKMVRQFEDDIISAIKTNTKAKLLKYKETLPTKILDKLQQKKKINKQYYRTLHPQIKTQLNNITNEIKEDLKNTIMKHGTKN